jgi:DNA mismatch endonuclease (patch repair protein)
MTDVFSHAQRSAVMAKVKSKNTVPEMTVRSLLHRLGYRFRLHRADLPGTPDIVLPRRRAVVFVHGCFWHQHAGCKRATLPTSNLEYWAAKLSRNTARDLRAVRQLRKLGWKVLIVWECQVNQQNLEKLAGRLIKALG